MSKRAFRASAHASTPRGRRKVPGVPTGSSPDRGILRALALASALGAALASLSLAAVPPARATGGNAPPSGLHAVRIEASYEPSTRTLTGRETLTWRNPSRVPVDELRFHLYLNAFSSPDSSFLRQSRASDIELLNEGGWGSIDIVRLRLDDGPDLTDAARFLRPDDRNPADRTLVAYPLPNPVPPGETVVVHLDFEARLPAIVARTGAAGDFVMGAQWFPKVGVFEPRGVRGRQEPGWAARQFHRFGEFYADFADYRVRLDLPARYAGKIGGTGRIVDERIERRDGDGDERVVVEMAQDGVHDFAWAADPRFLVVEDRFDPVRDVPPERRRAVAALLGRPAGDLRLQPVDLRLLVSPEHRRQTDRYLRAAKAALAGLGLRLGAYPYPTLTLVDPPDTASGAMGMEYPTFATLASHRLLELPLFRGATVAETVTLHEIAHQYFQGMVASHEVDEPWLDEGLATYFDRLLFEEWFGPDSLRFLGLRLGKRDDYRWTLLRRPYDDPVIRPSWQFRDENSWAMNSYTRPAAALAQLEAKVGKAAFARALRGYFETFEGRHPSSEDFEASLERTLGTGHRRFLRQALRSSRHLDYAVERVDSAPHGTGHRSVVEAVRRGPFRHPVRIEARFADGTVVERDWDGVSRWARWIFNGPSPIVSADLDPREQMPLDVNRLDNGRSRAADPTPRRRLLAHIVFWFQTLLQSGSLIG